MQNVNRAAQRVRIEELRIERQNARIEELQRMQQRRARFEKLRRREERHPFWAPTGLIRPRSVAELTRIQSLRQVTPTVWSYEAVQDLLDGQTRDRRLLELLHGLSEVPGKRNSILATEARISVRLAVFEARGIADHWSVVEFSSDVVCLVIS